MEAVAWELGHVLGGCSSIVALGMGNFSAGGPSFARASVPVQAGW